MALIDFEIVERAPLASNGKSGAQLERVRTAAGEVLVTKLVQPREDWIMQATGDDGRVFRLWSAGVFGQLPSGLDAAVVSVDEIADGWMVVMRDVTSDLVWPARPAQRTPRPRLTRAAGQRILNAAASLHAAFMGRLVEGLCPMVDRLAFLTPSVIRGIDCNPHRSSMLLGWERFAEVARADVAAQVLELLERPGQLAAALSAHRQTLLHGDLKVANVAFEDATVVLLDWGTLTGLGPPAMDYATYLALNGAAIDAILDEQLTDIVAALAPADRSAVPLALLGGLVQLGWEKALGATADDLARRAREQAGLRWWCDRAAEALDAWSPA